MKKVLLSLVVAGAAVGVMSQHGAGGGGGAGKAIFQDLMFRTSSNVLVSFGDGSVRTVRKGVSDRKVFDAFATPEALERAGLAKVGTGQLILANANTYSPGTLELRIPENSSASDYLLWQRQLGAKAAKPGPMTLTVFRVLPSGEVEAYLEYTLENSLITTSTSSARKGHDKWINAVSVSFDKAGGGHTSRILGTARGGVWKMAARP